MSEYELIDFYIRNAEILIQNDLMAGMLRSCGWFIIMKLLVPVAGACEGLYDASFGLVDFTSWEAVDTYIKAYLPVFTAVMVISLFALGIILVTNPERRTKTFLMNLCIAVLCVTSSTLVFQQMNLAVKDLKAGIDSLAVLESENDSVYDTVASGMIDWYQLDQKYGLGNVDYEKKQNITHGSFNRQQLNLLSINEVLDFENEAYTWNDSDAEEILSHKLIIQDGGYALEELDRGLLWTGIGSSLYYRYTFDFLSIVLQLGSLVVLYLCLSYKCVRLVFELVFGRLLATLYAAELSGGQRIYKILTFLRDTYITLLLTTVCVKLYELGSAYITRYVDGGLMSSFLLLFLTFSVIDGPNLVEKLLGMDVGLTHAFGKMMSMARFGSWAGRKVTSPIRGQAEKIHQNLKDKGHEKREAEGTRQNASDRSRRNQTDTSFMNRKEGEAQREAFVNSEAAGRYSDANSYMESSKNAVRNDSIETMMNESKKTSGSDSSESEAKKPEMKERDVKNDIGRSGIYDTSFMDHEDRNTMADKKPDVNGKSDFDTGSIPDSEKEKPNLAKSMDEKDFSDRSREELSTRNQPKDSISFMEKRKEEPKSSYREKKSSYRGLLKKNPKSKKKE